VSEYSDHVDAEALKAASVSNDGVTVSRRPLGEHTDRQKFNAAKEAMENPVAAFMARTMKMVPPGGH